MGVGETVTTRDERQSPRYYAQYSAVDRYMYRGF